VSEANSINTGMLYIYHTVWSLMYMVLLCRKVLTYYHKTTVSQSYILQNYLTSSSRNYSHTT